MLVKEVFELKRRRAHRDAQRFGLVTARHHTPVVATKHNNRLTLQIRPKQPLATNEKIIAIDERDHSSLIKPQGRRLTASVGRRIRDSARRI